MPQKSTNTACTCNTPDPPPRYSALVCYLFTALSFITAALLRYKIALATSLTTIEEMPYLILLRDTIIPLSTAANVYLFTSRKATYDWMRLPSTSPIQARWKIRLFLFINSLVLLVAVIDTMIRCYLIFSPGSKGDRLFLGIPYESCFIFSSTTALGELRELDGVLVDRMRDSHWKGQICTGCDGVEHEMRVLGHTYGPGSPPQALEWDDVRGYS